MQAMRVWSLSREDPLEKEWQPTPVLLLGKSHGQRSLVGCSSSHTTWRLNSNPLFPAPHTATAAPGPRVQQRALRPQNATGRRFRLLGSLQRGRESTWLAVGLTPARPFVPTSPFHRALGELSGTHHQLLFQTSRCSLKPLLKAAALQTSLVWSPEASFQQWIIPAICKFHDSTALNLGLGLEGAFCQPPAALSFSILFQLLKKKLTHPTQPTSAAICCKAKDFFFFFHSVFRLNNCLGAKLASCRNEDVQSL